MFGLKPVALGVAFAGTAATMTLTAASAQAFSIGDTLNVGGVATFGNDLNPPTDEIDFENPGTVLGSSDGAFGGYIGTNAIVKDLLLTQDAGITYFGAVENGNPFVTLTGNTAAAGDDIFFDVDEPLTILRQVVQNPLTGSGGIAYSFPQFTGVFRNASGSALGTGFVTVNQFNSDGSYSMSIEVIPTDTGNPTAVPEPLTILGAGTAVAFGGAFKRKLGKKDKKGSTKA
ncbi:PEP-CTERM sorting domain-containing protein [Crocosphaera chwakensis]|uniref:PEP-CTERM protein-sorting domain-containing protein n=1 Tax=Crocosphaera chwakensis CCY0110 TaxID=391612 RepID=A3ITS7_9CHRO|nr:PEP-CTERM sorting domain-containing protein [Crocosphaera chwakensis]EAZ90143.1 hypothetical protein CY0110_06069 [Crocosphaera chwakensis CCY0110]